MSNVGTFGGAAGGCSCSSRGFAGSAALLSRECGGRSSFTLLGLR